MSAKRQLLKKDGASIDLKSYICRTKKSYQNMSNYIPLFTVSAKAINLIADISALIERYAIRMEQADALRLRKENRIRTICSSLAIEGNRLTEAEVATLLNGRNVVGPLKDVTEVKNAIKVYEAYDSFNPFAVADLLRAHRMMMEALVDDAGMFRKGGVGVFAGRQLIHMAPPAERVPFLIDELLKWLRLSDDHLLVRSCVFHYEFEFIHPFSDGNGRMGRLWQSLILGKIHPLFAHLPIENVVYHHQQAYYDAIAMSDAQADSGPFIDFMLDKIRETLEEHQGRELVVEVDKVPNKVPNKVPDKWLKAFPNLSETTWHIYTLIKENPRTTNLLLAQRLGISDRMVRKHVMLLKSIGLLTRVGSNKTGYWKLK